MHEFPHYKNNHHCVPTSRNGSKHCPENITRINKKVHDRIHALFGNQTPVEQIETVVSMNIRCLRREFVAAILRLLENEGDYHYKK
jgi:hypothetical protein